MSYCPRRRHRWALQYQLFDDPDADRESWECLGCGRRKEVVTHQDGSVLTRYWGGDGLPWSCATGRYRHGEHVA